MRELYAAAAVLLLTTDFVSAEPFQEVTVGVPVSSLAEAQSWYLKLFGAQVEVFEPVPGVVEFNVAPGVWFQVFEVEDHQPSETVVRFLVDDMATSQAEWAEAGIDTGEAIEVPDLITFSEFTDPDGNALGLYDLP